MLCALPCTFPSRKQIQVLCFQAGWELPFYIVKSEAPAFKRSPWIWGWWFASHLKWPSWRLLMGVYWWFHRGAPRTDWPRLVVSEWWDGTLPGASGSILWAEAKVTMSSLWWLFRLFWRGEPVQGWLTGRHWLQGLKGDQALGREKTQETSCPKTLAMAQWAFSSARRPCVVGEPGSVCLSSSTPEGSTQGGEGDLSGECAGSHCLGLGDKFPVLTWCWARGNLMWWRKGLLSKLLSGGEDEQKLAFKVDRSTSWWRCSWKPGSTDKTGVRGPED